MGTDVMNIFFGELFHYLVGKKPEENDIKIFQKNNKKLETNGDFRFVLIYSAWKQYINEISSEKVPLLELIDTSSINNGVEKLINVSKTWSVSIRKCAVVCEEELHVFLDRVKLFRCSIEYILSTGNNHGLSVNKPNKSLELRADCEETDLSVMSLTQLRLNLFKEVADNLLKINIYQEQENLEPEVIYLTNKSQSSFNKKIVCGKVISNKFGKKNPVTAEEFYSKRTVDMRLMAQHKYGVRVNTESGWQEFFKQLGSAAVTFDLLYVKPNKAVVLNIDNPVPSSSKGASFILYNCARVAEIFKQFDKKVASGVYPSLPNIGEIDFTLLNQPEEWEILYIYLMQYPELIRNCIKDLLQYHLSTYKICMFLESLCSTFSIYYRRVRILTEARAHLIPVLHSRMYLLKAIQQTLHNALALLNIPPVKQM